MDRLGKACGHNPDMHTYEKSDIVIAPKKAPNNTGLPVAEVLDRKADGQGKFWKAVCDLRAEAGGSIDLF